MQGELIPNRNLWVTRSALLAVLGSYFAYRGAHAESGVIRMLAAAVVAFNVVMTFSYLRKWLANRGVTARHFTWDGTTLVLPGILGGETRIRRDEITECTVRDAQHQLILVTTHDGGRHLLHSQDWLREGLAALGRTLTEAGIAKAANDGTG